MNGKRRLYLTAISAALGLSVYVFDSRAEGGSRNSCEENLVFDVTPSKYTPVQGNLWISDSGVLAEVQPFTLNSKQVAWSELKERQKRLGFEPHLHGGILGMVLAVDPKALVRFVKEELVFDKESQTPSWEWQVFEGQVVTFEEKPYQSGLRVVLEKKGEEIQLDIPAKSGYTLSYFVKSKKE